MEKDEIVKTLKEINAEIGQAFLDWNLKIDAHQQPVAIQDLDFWNKKLQNIIDELANQPYSLPSERMVTSPNSIFKCEFGNENPQISCGCGGCSAYFAQQEMQRDAELAKSNARALEEEASQEEFWGGF